MVEKIFQSLYLGPSSNLLSKILTPVLIGCLIVLTLNDWTRKGLYQCTVKGWMLRTQYERRRQWGCLVLVPFCDPLTSSCAHTMEIRCQHWIWLGHTITQIRSAQYQVVRPYSHYNWEKKGLTPVDPAGPDCYQSGTKPCESTLQSVAYGSVTRSQHAQRTWITSGNWG